MKVRLERTFPIPADVETTWCVLSDIETVAGCMPGARITERIDDAHYKGTVAVRLGPANLTFRGEIFVAERDAATCTLRLSAKGTDTTGGSVAAMELTTRAEPVDAANSTLFGHSEATVGGKAAAFGGRMMDAVSEQILKQFAANFSARVVERAAAMPNASGSTPAATTPMATSTDASATTASAAASAAAAARAAPTPTAVPAAAAPGTEAPSLNALALLWAIVRGWFRGLFGKKRSG